MLNQKRQCGFSLIELLVVIAIILIILTMAAPQYHKVIMHARETSAVNSLRTIAAAQVTYMSQYARYAASLAELGPPPTGEPNAAGAQLIGNGLANGVKEGYQFRLAVITGGYSVNADPAVFDSDGSRTFYMDQTMVIRENRGREPATAGSKELR